MSPNSRTAVLLVLTLAWPTLTRAQGETITYMHTDGIGSVRMLTNESGQILARYDYLPFGELCTTACGNSTSTATTRQFAGKERDAETGLDYFGGRYLASLGGRFTTVDPVLDVEGALTAPQQWNRYAYVYNNPFRFIDPDGRQGIESAIARDDRALSNKQITPEEYNARSLARGAGGAVGAIVAAGPLAWRVAIGCFLSPSCQSGTINFLEGTAGGVSTPLTSGRLLPALASTTREALLEAAVAEGRGGVSLAGTALQSHATRAGSWLSGLARGGNGAANTAAARKALEEVLESGKVSYYTHKAWGDVISIRLPDGRGAIWSAEGTFITFLERYSAQ